MWDPLCEWVAHSCSGVCISLGKSYNCHVLWRVHEGVKSQWMIFFFKWVRQWAWWGRVSHGWRAQWWNIRILGCIRLIFRHLLALPTRLTHAEWSLMSMSSCWHDMGLTCDLCPISLHWGTSRPWVPKPWACLSYVEGPAWLGLSRLGSLGFRALSLALDIPPTKFEPKLGLNKKNKLLLAQVPMPLQISKPAFTFLDTWTNVSQAQQQDWILYSCLHYVSCALIFDLHKSPPSWGHFIRLLTTSLGGRKTEVALAVGGDGERDLAWLGAMANVNSLPYVRSSDPGTPCGYCLSAGA